MNLDRLSESVKLHEGFRDKPYLDSVGVLTIGYGTNIAEGISKAEAEFLLYNRLSNALAGARNLFRNFERLSDVRQEVLVEMCYQIGVTRLAGFKKMIAAVEADDPDTTAVEMLDDVIREMLDSKWAKIQSPRRAQDLAEEFRKG